MHAPIKPLDEQPEHSTNWFAAPPSQRVGRRGRVQVVRSAASHITRETAGCTSTSCRRSDVAQGVCSIQLDARFDQFNSFRPDCPRACGDAVRRCETAVCSQPSHCTADHVPSSASDVDSQQDAFRSRSRPKIEAITGTITVLRTRRFIEPNEEAPNSITKICT